MAKPPAPDGFALEVAYRSMATTLPIAQVLDDPALRRLLYLRARQHMRRRERFDPKRLQANDNDD